MEAEARVWMEAVLGEPLGDGTLQELLKSGVVLCNLVNALKPGSVKKISTKKMPFMQMENIANYLAAVGPSGLGIPAFETFMTIDLYEEQNMQAVVLNIHSLGRLAQSFYSGATLGAKMATRNKREFTEEQMNAGKTTVGVFGKGSHVSAQADAKANLGEGEGAPTALQKQDSNPPAIMQSTVTELVKRVSSATIEPVAAEEPSAVAAAPLPAVASTGDPEADARTWIESVLGEPLGDGTLHEVLKSGVALCNLLNKITPGCCPKPTNKKLPFMQMENISNYLTACNSKFSIQSFESFMTVDLFEDKNMGAVVLNVLALARAVGKK